MAVKHLHQPQWKLARVADTGVVGGARQAFRGQPSARSPGPRASLGGERSPPMNPTRLTRADFLRYTSIAAGLTVAAMSHLSQPSQAAAHPAGEAGGGGPPPPGGTRSPPDPPRRRP